jgi:hypothetical protein
MWWTRYVMFESIMNKRQFRVIAAVVALTFVASFTLTAQEQDKRPEAEAVLAAADRVRNPGKPFRAQLILTEFVQGKERDRTSLIVYARQDVRTLQFNNLVRYAQPPRDAGKMVLFRGTDLWFYDPASKASVRISPQQRLLGQASEGDVLAVNFARDYTAQITGEESLRDADGENHECWRLDMTAAASPDAIYSHIEYWVDRWTSRPIKGKFYSDSGQLLKIAYYHKYSEQLGAVRPMETILLDGVNSNLATVISYSAFRFQEVPEVWFQRDYLPRLAPE